MPCSLSLFACSFCCAPLQPTRMVATSADTPFTVRGVRGDCLKSHPSQCQHRGTGRIPLGRSRGMSACPVESEGEGAGIISMRLPSQCRPNTGRIQFFPILFCPCDVKHTASLHGFAVFDEALHNCLRQFKHHFVCSKHIASRNTSASFSSTHPLWCRRSVRAELLASSLVDTRCCFAMCNTFQVCHSAVKR